MAHLTDAEIDAAKAHGTAMLETEPRAASARYDRQTGCVTVQLLNGDDDLYAFKTDLVEDLNGATSDDLEVVEVDGAGFNLHWPRLGADLYVPALVAGVFGTRHWTNEALARQAEAAQDVAMVEPGSGWWPRKAVGKQ